MKRCCILLLLACSLSAHADGFNYMTAVCTNLEQSFGLNTLKAVSFTSTDVVFQNTDGTQVSLPLANLTQLNLTQNATAIENVNKESKEVAEVAHVYAANGVIVKQQRVADIAEVTLSSLPHGMYIVKKGNQTLKVIR